MRHLDELPADQQEQLDPEVVPEWLDPMLATLTDDHFSDPDWLFERKLDGERAIAYVADGDVRLMSRNRKDLVDTYPEIEDALAGLDTDGLVVDGEVVAFSGDVTSFARLQPRMQISDRREARASDVRVFFYIFDLLHLDGRSTRQLPLRTRKSLLRQAVSFDDPLRFVTHRNEHGEALLDEACAQGWEGLIAKRADGTYQPGRSRTG
jgi:bifunctional non-homologous end joining protein LigD